MFVCHLANELMRKFFRWIFEIFHDTTNTSCWQNSISQDIDVQFADCRSVSSCLISLAMQNCQHFWQIDELCKLRGSPFVANYLLHSASSSPLLLCNVRPDRISRFDRDSCVVACNARCRHLHICVWIACECRINDENAAPNILCAPVFSRSRCWSCWASVSFAIVCVPSFGRWNAHVRSLSVNMGIQITDASIEKDASEESVFCFELFHRPLQRCTANSQRFVKRWMLLLSTEREKWPQPRESTISTRDNSSFGLGCDCVSHRCIDLWQLARIIQVRAVDLSRHRHFYGFTDYDACPGLPVGQWVSQSLDGVAKLIKLFYKCTMHKSVNRVNFTYLTAFDRDVVVIVGTRLMSGTVIFINRWQ